jgi:hypothetical protein
MSEVSKGGFGAAWQAIKSLAVEETPDSKPSKTPTTLSIPGSIAAYMPGASSAPATVDPKSMEKLQAKIRAEIDGGRVQAYSAFSEQYELLKDVIADENVRFKSALKVSRTTVEQLSADIDKLIAVIHGAHEDFTKKFEANKAAAQKQSGDAAAMRSTAISAKQQQINALKAEIHDIEVEEQNDRAAHMDELNGLDALQSGFEAAHAQVLGQLVTQKTHVASQKG